jgi:formamidopyrimidine-DNA glycosylase
MPELPEIECLRSRLANQFRGQRIDGITVHCPSLRQGITAKTFVSTSGLILKDVLRRGKFLILQLSDETCLLLHCGMSGRLVSRHLSKPHDLFSIVFSDNTRLMYNDFRRFGRVWRVRAPDILDHPALRSLGPEPLSRRFNQECLDYSSKRAVKTVLLDQQVVAGLGNIYSCESLYHARIRPDRRWDSLSTEELLHLVKAIRSTLRSAIKHGGSTLEDYRDTEGEAGNYDSKFAVFNHEGLRCPKCECDAGVVRIKQAGRSTFFCPSKQK